MSTLTGIFDVMNAFAVMPRPTATVPGSPPFRVEIVGREAGPLPLVSGIPVGVQKVVGEVAATDIVIVPSVVVPPEGWTKGRHPETVAWLRRMHDRGAILCSACSGIFLLAETGLWDGVDATVHFGYARHFQKAFPPGPDPPRPGPRRRGPARGARDLGRLDDLWHDLCFT